MDDGTLIEQVTLFPQLYVKSDPRYKNLRMKENAWKTIAVILEETPEACEHRWKILRNKYTTLKREHKYEPSGSEASEITWPYFDLMKFLDPYLVSRKSFSNLSIKRKPDAIEWDSMSTIVDEDLSQDDIENCPERSIEDEEGTSTSSQIQKQKKISVIPRQTAAKTVADKIKQTRTNIPRHTIPAKRQKTDILAEKMTGCFDTFQKVLESSNTSHQPSQPDNDEHFVRSLVQDLTVFSRKEKILIKREIYNVLANHLESVKDSD